jgi:hypothetical protein
MPIRTRRGLSMAWALALGVVTASRASAEDPCAADVRQFCPDVKPGTAQISSCLRESQARLSATCREKLDADALRAKRFIEEFGRACRPDVEQFCLGVEPGQGRVLGCLSLHQVELSPTCEGEMNRISEARERVANVRRVCTADVERLCHGVPPLTGPVLECLKTNEARLSSGCSAAGLREAMDAGILVDVVEEMSSRDRVREALQILQGLDSVAFSRSQILLQYDSYEGFKQQANASRLLFNPQFVFGDRREFSFQVKVPVSTFYPYTAGAPTQSGLGSVNTSLAWNFLSARQVRQYLALGVQWQTASSGAIGGPWALAPAYAIAVGLARGVSLTTQVVWIRSVESTPAYAEMNLLQVEPILVVALPGRSFVALDTRLGWDFASDTFLPLVKGMAGLFVDRQKSLSISAWYQASLTSAAEKVTFDYGVGLGLAYYFDW